MLLLENTGLNQNGFTIDNVNSPDYFSLFLTPVHLMV